MPHNLFNSRQTLTLGAGRTGQFYSLPQLEKVGVGPISRLPVSLRIVLESVLRNCDGKKITEEDVRALANWRATAERTQEIPFVVARILLQDFTGVPLLVDLAAMRSAVARLGRDTKLIEPLVPVDLVIDHSVQVDYAGTTDALRLNMEMEFKRNRARYQFLKWGMQAFKSLRVVPPGIGIVHQVNLEYLAKGVLEKEGIYYPDTLVGTDSHTTMINGLGVVGWGVGGIEAEAGMLGQPVYFLTPDVVGVHLSGTLREGVTATDLVLHLTQLLRKANVVGKFVEYHGEGVATLPVPDRATIGNMAPEYGATMGFFPIDEETCTYLKATGRTDEQVETFRNYFKAQGLFGIPRKGECAYSTMLELNLADVRPSVAGPKRPQDRIDLPQLKDTFLGLLQKPLNENGYNKPKEEIGKRFPTALSTHRPTPDRMAAVPAADGPPVQVDLRHGDVVIAAITSCTNTSNPSVMLAAGLVAKKAVEKGLSVPPQVKASLAPGSRVVTAYFEKTGLQPYLNQLGLTLVGYGCTTCIGNSGPLDPQIEEVVTQNDLIVASVLSGNRNFEARVHPSVKANFLMSPPLVVAFALAGRVDIDLAKEPIGRGKDGQAVYLRDIWPSLEEVHALIFSAFDPDTYRKLYSDFTAQNPLWHEIPSPTGAVYEWDPESTYIQEPPFFEKFSLAPGTIANLTGARPLAIFGDSVTTDHISPAGSIKATSPAGLYLQAQGVAVADFNSYGSRRGNDRVMTRGTFANVRIKNLMVPGVEGGVTKYQPHGEQMSIYDAALKYQAAGVPLVVLGSEVFDLVGLEPNLQPRQDVTLIIHRADGQTEELPVTLRIDTPIEIEYYRHGGILPYVLRQLLAQD